MAALETTSATMIDWAKLLDPDGDVADVVEMLSQDNEILQDIIMVQANGILSHRVTIRTGLGGPGTWRRLYQGIQPTRATTAQVEEAMGNLEDLTEVDKDEADLNGNTLKFRLSQNEAKMEMLSQQMATTIIYGDAEQYPDRFTGLAPRFNAISGAANGDNILDGGGVGSDNTSIWLIPWDEKSVFGLFPKDSKVGLQHDDMGVQLIQNSDGSKYKAYVDHYKWELGICVKDWRRVVRIANIDVTTLTSDAAAGADLFDLLAQALEIIKGMGNIRIYCNRKISSFMRRQRTKAQNVVISMDEVAGKKVLAVDGNPVRRVDAILNNEDAIA
ncbi:MAG: hypothetical protein GC155_06230 [Alphaproteobacteria bacterium]|nr:hypothetical protein [Alphaproteobacteria bacterium]